MALLITEKEVDQLLDFQVSLSAVEEAFRAFGEGKAVAPPRVSVSTPAGMWRTAFASIPSMGAMGVKAYTSFHFMTDEYRDEDRIVFLLYCSLTGRLLAIIGSYRLSQLRTGATSALAVKHLSRPDSTTMGLLGSGVHARAELEGISLVRKITRVKVFSPQKMNCQKFADEMSSRLSLDIVPVDSVAEAIQGVDIISTVTTSSTPLFEGDFVVPGLHINAVGANSPDRLEISSSVIEKCKPVVTDCKEQAMIESANLMSAVDGGAVRWHQVRELGEIVHGTAPGRQGVSDSTLFISNGFAIEDVAVAMKAYQLASAQGLGSTVSLRESLGKSG